MTMRPRLPTGAKRAERGPMITCGTDSYLSVLGNSSLEDRSSRHPAVAGVARPAFSVVTCESSASEEFLKTGSRKPVPQVVFSRFSQVWRRSTSVWLECMRMTRLPKVFSKILTNWLVRAISGTRRMVDFCARRAFSAILR